MIVSPILGFHGGSWGRNFCVPSCINEIVSRDRRQPMLISIRAMVTQQTRYIPVPTELPELGHKFPKLRSCHELGTTIQTSCVRRTNTELEIIIHPSRSWWFFFFLWYGIKLVSGQQDFHEDVHRRSRIREYFLRIQVEQKFISLLVWLDS